MSRPHVARRVAGLRPTAVNSVLREVRQLQAAGGQVDSLMRGQPDTPTPEHIVAAAVRAIRDGRTGYPDNQGEPGLRRAVAERLARDYGMSYDPDREILITDGATLGLAVALAALVEPDDTVLIPDPDLRRLWRTRSQCAAGDRRLSPRKSDRDVSRSAAPRWRAVTFRARGPS